MCMFCGGTCAGNSGALLAFGTMAGFRADLDRLQIRPERAPHRAEAGDIPVRPQPSSEAGAEGPSADRSQ